MLTHLNNTVTDVLAVILITMTTDNITHLMALLHYAEFDAAYNLVKRVVSNNSFWMLKLRSHFDINSGLVDSTCNWASVYIRLVEFQETPMVACVNGFATDLNILLSNNRLIASTFDPISVTILGWTTSPFSVCKHRKFSIYEMFGDKLLGTNEKPIEGNILATINNDYCGHAKALEILLQRGEYKNTHEFYLHMAVKYGYIEAVKLLLQYLDVDPTIEDGMILRIASHNGYTEIVRLLLDDPRIDSNDNDNMALRNACGCNPETVGLSLQYPRAYLNYCYIF